MGRSCCKIYIELSSIEEENILEIQTFNWNACRSIVFGWKLDETHQYIVVISAIYDADQTAMYKISNDVILKLK